MSVSFKCSEMSVWSVSNRPAHCFLDILRVLEREVSTESGVSEVISDQVFIDLPQLQVFLKVCGTMKDSLKRHTTYVGLFRYHYIQLLAFVSRVEGIGPELMSVFPANWVEEARVLGETMAS